MKLRLSWNELQDYIAKESHMRYFFHVDVIDLKHSDVIDVSEYSNTKSLLPEVIHSLNIEITTRWHPWGPCSVCDDDGIRKRMGICVVRKHDSNKPVGHDYLRNILSFAEDGIPCKSQFLREFQQEPWLRKPNLIQMEECYVPCQSVNSKRRKRGLKFISQSEVAEKEKQTKTDKANAKVKSKKLKVKIGSYFILKCKGRSLTKTINWVNGTTLINSIKIKKVTNNRVTIDMFGNMHFKAASVYDSGTYSCWIKKNVKRKYIVRIEEDRSADILKYTIYLCITFIFYFGAFLMLLIIKCMQRRVHRRNHKKKATFSDEDTDIELGMDDDSTSSSDDSD